MEFRDDQEANAAIAALNGTDLRGRTINVNQARPKVERGGWSAAAAAAATDASPGHRDCQRASARAIRARSILIPSR